MSQNLTQPEEVDHALMEMSRRGFRVDILANDIRHLYQADHEITRGEFADQEKSCYSAIHMKSRIDIAS